MFPCFVRCSLWLLIACACSLFLFCIQMCSSVSLCVRWSRCCSRRVVFAACCVYDSFPLYRIGDCSVMCCVFALCCVDALCLSLLFCMFLCVVCFINSISRPVCCSYLLMVFVSCPFSSLPCLTFPFVKKSCAARHVSIWEWCLAYTKETSSSWGKHLMHLGTQWPFKKGLTDGPHHQLFA